MSTNPDWASFAKCADKSHKLMYFFIAKALPIRRHFAFASGDDVEELGIRLCLHFSRAQVADLQTLSRGRVSASISAVTGHAFRFEDSRTVIGRRYHCLRA